MKTKWKYILGLGVIVLTYHVYRSYSPIDGFQGFLWRTFTGEDTLYAPKYNDRGFIAIKLGMSHEQAYQLIGPPLEAWTNQNFTVSQRWSKSPSDSNYRSRVLVFSNNVVVVKHSEFYED